jgi:hypothetical protein
MRRFLVYCSIVGAVGSHLQSLSPALAQVPANTCQIVSSAAGQMFANPGLATRLESNSSDSYFRVACNGTVNGKLRLSFGAGNKLYNSSAKFKVVGANGCFANAASGYDDSPVEVSYSNASGITTGEVRYQIQIAAPSNTLMPAATDYAVQIRAELIQ